MTSPLNLPIIKDPNGPGHMVEVCDAACAEIGRRMGLVQFMECAALRDRVEALAKSARRRFDAAAADDALGRAEKASKALMRHLMANAAELDSLSDGKLAQELTAIRAELANERAFRAEDRQTIDIIKADLAAERERIRSTCQKIVAVIGADGPDNIEDALGRFIAKYDAARAEPATERQHRNGHLPDCAGMDMERMVCGCGYLDGTGYRTLMAERDRLAARVELEKARAMPLEVADELALAVAKFPTWPTDVLHALAVLGEEFGELTQAALQSVYEPNKANPGAVRAEAIQVAAMALRFLASVGTYETRPSAQHEQKAGG
jgi:uncharacterized membrane protein YidH (DUF202 family)